MATPQYVFLDDRIVPWDEGTVHVDSAAFKFGSAVFEGLRGYWNAEQEEMFLFRMEEHMDRLVFSQRFMRYDEIITPAYVAEKTLELIRANGFRGENVHSRMMETMVLTPSEQGWRIAHIHWSSAPLTDDHDH